MADKLFVIVRADLSPGQQGVQSLHAALTFQRQNLAVCDGLDNLAWLAVPDERALAQLIRRLGDAGVRWEGFQEVDLGGQLTAVAFGPEGAKLVSSLPCALKPPRVRDVGAGSLAAAPDGSPEAAA